MGERPISGLKKKKKKARVCIVLLRLANSFKKHSLGLPCWLSDEESTCQSRGHRFDP